ncbi:MAG: TonB-dependent receptor plug domain-containing protein [Syntrophobacteraceae bacterium]
MISRARRIGFSFVACRQVFSFTLAGLFAFSAASTIVLPKLCTATQAEPDLTDLSLEALMDIEVTSVSKRAQKLSDAAAAIFVITQEDIHRSGATTVPQLLRMVPGLHVAQIDANKWSVTSRGFSGRFANKLLVLIDGRSIYTPIFSGVFWEAQDVMLEDIDRIEVIRGPGASLWGANAVNGVINIVSKKAKDTQGGLVTAGGGTEERGFGSVRYGSRVGDSTFWRAYGKYADRDGFETTTGEEGADDWRSYRGGFRLDHTISLTDSLTFFGDLYKSVAGVEYGIPSLTPPFQRKVRSDMVFSGGDILGRWTHNFSNTSAMTVQMYYDRLAGDDFNFSVNDDTFDFDMQHQFKLGSRQEVIWGLGYRYWRDHTDGSFLASFDPAKRCDNLFSSFVQDEISLVDQKLSLILGSKFEHNDYTGFEVQPSGRLIWTPTKQQSVWAAVSRAVRTPSRAEDDAILNTAVVPVTQQGLPLSVTFFGRTSTLSEELIAFELGYRVQPNERLSFDFATFYNVYDHLTAFKLGRPFLSGDPVPHLVRPLLQANEMSGETYGFEAAMGWQALNWLNLKAEYAFIEMKLSTDPVAHDSTIEKRTEGSTPHHQFSVRSMMDLPCNFQLDLWFRVEDKLPALDVSSYANMDVRLAWKALKNLEFSIVGQNLLQDQHLEFRPDFLSTPATEVQRGVYGKVLWKF